MLTMTDFERAVLQKLLTGDHPILNALSAQVAASRIGKREFTGVGFFTTFELSAGAPRAPLPPGRIAFGDVIAEIQGLKHGAGFVLFIENGYIDFLEGYTYDEPWPERITDFQLKYMGGELRDLSSLETN